MRLPSVVVDAVAGVEDALDRLKLSYKVRFDRFGPARPVPYRWYGRPDRLVLRGRVLEADETGFQPEPGFLDNVRNTVRRLETDEIRGAVVRATFRGDAVEVRADDEAFFEVRFDPDPPVEAGWHEIRLEVLESMAGEDAGPAIGEVLVPPEAPDFIVVSDLDDTVVRTGATRPLGMLRKALLNDADTRLPFDGVPAFYAALRAGPSGDGRNPIFYLSRSPWNMYGMLTGFLEHRGLPKGPLLLKDYGLRSVLGRTDENHKRETLDALLEFYPEPPFVLIGDSGQHDPENYRDIALGRPERVRAVIIRDVTPPGRDREVNRIADELDAVGVPMIVAADTSAAARDAADLGLIPEDRLDDIDADRRSEDPAPSPSLFQRIFGNGHDDGAG